MYAWLHAYEDVFQANAHIHTHTAISRKWCVVWAVEWVVFVQCREKYVYFHRYCHCFPWNSFELIRCALDLGQKNRIYIQIGTIKHTNHIICCDGANAHPPHTPNIFAAFVIFFRFIFACSVTRTATVLSMWDFGTKKKTEEICIFVLDNLSMLCHTRPCTVCAGRVKWFMFCSDFLYFSLRLRHITHWLTYFFVFFAPFGSS